MPPTVAPIHLDVGKDSDPRLGFATFTVSLGRGSCNKQEPKQELKPRDEESSDQKAGKKCDEGTSIVMYLANPDGTRVGNPLADLPISEFLTGHELAGVVIPNGITHLTALARNVHGEMPSGPLTKFTDNKTETLAAWINMRALVANNKDVTSLWRPFSHENNIERVHDGLDSGVTALALDDLGYDAFSGHSNGKVACLDMAFTNKVWYEFSGRGRVVALAADGETMKALRGTTSGSLELWDLNSGQATNQLVGHTFDIGAINADWAGERAVTASLDGHVVIWDLKTGAEVARAKDEAGEETGSIPDTASAHRGGVYALATSWEKGFVLSGSEDETLKLWSLEGLNLVTTLEGHSNAVRFISADWEQMRALSVSSERVGSTVKLWDLRSYECILTFQEQHDSQILAVQVSWPSMQAMAITVDGRAAIWDLKEPDHNPLSTAFFGSEIKVATIASSGQDRRSGKSRRAEKLGH